MSETVFSPLFSKLYGHWLKNFPAADPEKTVRPACEPCAMSFSENSTCGQSRGWLTRDPGPFAADLKCCTYSPFVPNFAVGAILKEAGAETLAILRSEIQSARAQPLGLFPRGGSGANTVPGQGKKSQRHFGKDSSHLCPFYDRDERKCRVWDQRPAVCSSYQCVSTKGAAGFAFWQDLESYVNQFEWTLAHDCLWQLGWSPGEILRGWRPEDSLAKREDFFLNAYGRAMMVSSAEITNLLGDIAAELKASLHHQFELLK